MTNFQSGDTVALAIESVRRFTKCPYEMIVYDDASDPVHYGDDLTYLRAAQEKGWIKFIEGNPHGGWGCGIRTMLNAVTTDLAMILDCDIQILRSGWLEKMIAHQEATGAAMITDMEVFPDNVSIASWFFMLDMAQYPFIKPAEWDYTTKPEFISWDATPMALYPAGHQIYKNILDQGRILAPFPQGISSFPNGPGAYYHHPCHISVLSMPMSGPNFDVRKQKYEAVQAELIKLRKDAS